jgi:type IV fimbrial biogenesis protein FimT
MALTAIANTGEYKMNITTKQQSQRGFTLIELMIVLLIVAVLGAMGGPVLDQTVKQNRLRTEADRILTTLNLVRSEAVKQNQPVSVCRSSNGTTCSGNWEDGWIVFTNSDGDDTVDVGVDKVVRAYAGLTTGYTLGGTIESNTLTYFADGSYAGGSGSIHLCSPDADASQGWSVMLNTVGRPRVSHGVSGCS